jgi:hypothetical protein
MADSPTIERRTTSAEAATVDPIMREPVVLWMVEDVVGLDPNEAAPHIRSSLDAIMGAESSGGRNTTGVANKNTGNRALGNYQWFPVPFKEDLEALDIYLRKAAGVEKKDWTTPDWITEAIEHRDPRKLSDHKQDLVQMARITRLAKNDDIAKMWMGDIPALRDFYAIKHHTQGYEDEATLRQMDRYMPLPDDYSPIAEPPELEQYADLNSPEKPPSNPAIELGRLNIEDYDPEPTPLGASDFDFDRANRGMLSEITDLPTRRSGAEILREATVPQRGGRIPEITVPQRAGRIPMVAPTQRSGRFPEVSVEARRRSGAEILQEQQAISSRVDPTLPSVPPRGQAEPRLESELAATQMATENGRFSDAEVTSSRVDPTPPRVPELEEVVPTQRGRVPVPERAPVEPEKPLPPELNEVDLSSLPEFKDQSYERTDPPAVIEDRRAGIKASIPKAPSRDEARESIRSSIPKSTGVSDDPDKRTGAERRFDRSRDTVLTGATLGAYDEVAGFLNQAFAGTPYDETVSQIRKNVAEQRLMNPTLAGFQEIIPGLVTGGGIASQLVKRGAGLATASGAEGAFTGAMYGETPTERAGLAVMGGTIGATVGGAIGWAITPSTKATQATVSGGRTAVDDLADDQILETTIEQVIKDGTTVKYRTNNGQLKNVTVVSTSNDGNVIVKDGANQFAVPKAKIEKVNVGKTTEGAMREAEEIGQFLDVNKPFTVKQSADKTKGEYDKFSQGDNAYALDVDRQLRMLADEYSDTVNVNAQAKRFSYIDEKPYTKGRKADEQRYTNWRDATTAGEFFDGVKQLIRDFYNDKLVGASDYIMKIAPEAGAKFQRFTETALRNNTMSFENIMVPIEKMIKGMDQDDKMLKALIMDYTNTVNLVTRSQAGQDLIKAGDQEGLALLVTNTANQNLSGLMRHITERYGADQAGAFARYLGWNKSMKGVHAKYINGERGLQNSPVVHIHTQLTPEVKATKLKKKNTEFRDDFEIYPDSAKEFRTRPSIVEDLRNGGTLVDEYHNPILTDFRRTANYENLNQMAKVFDLPETVVEQQPAKMFNTLRSHLISKGVSETDADTIAKVIRDDFVGQSRSPANWIQFLNSWGYAGSLAGPKSAVLNLHDIPMAAVLYGPGSFKGVFKKMGYKVEDKGIRQNVGEFMNYMQEQLNAGPASLSKQLADASRKGTDLLMRGSGFAWMDGVGKNAITRMIVQDAVDNVDRLRAKWGFYFSESELALIEKQIRKHGTDVGSMTGKGAQLMEELFFAGLGQQQLISSAGRPAAWSRNPNFRFMWALRGFAIKQLALAQRNIFDNIAKGNKKAAWEYMQRYALFSAGAFGLLNESRQWVWGDGNFTASGVVMGFADQIVSTASINTIGLNDYQWGKMMEDGIVITWLRSLVPIGADIPLDTLGDLVDAYDGDIKGQEGLNAGQRLAYPFAQFPIIRQWSKALDNMADTNLLGIDIQAPLPQPLDDINRRYLLTENGPRESDG